MLRASWFVIAIAVTQLVYSVVLCIKSSVRNIIVSTGIMFLLGYVLVVVYRDLPEWFVENHWLHSKELPNRLPACVNLAFVQSPFFALGILYRHFECRIPKYLIEDMKYLIRLFFESASKNIPVYEKILCSGSYRNISDQINKKIMTHRKKTNKGAFSDDEAYENIIFAYYGANSTVIYRQWVADGKKLSLDEVTDLAVNLVSYGLSSVMKK